jgi:CHAD domain-containing protein
MMEGLTRESTAVEAGRLVLAQELEKMRHHMADVQATADLVAVHEMRKAIRRSFTAYRIFAPYFAPEMIRYYRRRLRRIMRRLGRSRDVTIFREGLAAYNVGAERPLSGLAAYWDEQQRAADATLQAYLARPKRAAFLERYQAFCETPGLGTAVRSQDEHPPRISYVAPVMIYQRLADVRATGERLQQLSVAELHQLRIQFKELRYALDFLAPILGPQVAELLVSLNDVQDHLGAINDARVALLLLDEVPGMEEAVAQYRAYQTQELARLAEEFTAVWNKIDRPQWRRMLAAAVGEL